MTRTRPFDRRGPLEIVETTVTVRNQHRDRGPGGSSEPDATQILGGVRLDLLTRSATVATLATSKFTVDEVGVDLHAAGDPLEEGDDTRAMGFAGGAIGEFGHGAPETPRSGDRDRSVLVAHQSASEIVDLEFAQVGGGDDEE
jgi:hypothetical protein